MYFFFPKFFGHVGKRLDEKAKVIFKINDVTDWEKIIAMHILLNILRTKSHHTTKFSQFI